MPGGIRRFLDGDAAIEAKLKPSGIYSASPLRQGLPRVAESLCPECFRTIPARLFEQEGRVLISKECPSTGISMTWYPPTRRYSSG